MKATLENILCVIHRDGGNYISEHGIQKAFNDALEIHYRQRDAEERLSTIVQQSLSGSDDKSSFLKCSHKRISPLVIGEDSKL